jgi:hypothetical protein
MNTGAPRSKQINKSRLTIISLSGPHATRTPKGVSGYRHHGICGQAGMFMLTPCQRLASQAVGQPRGMNEVGSGHTIEPVVVPDIAIALHLSYSRRLHEPLRQFIESALG